MLMLMLTCSLALAAPGGGNGSGRPFIVSTVSNSRPWVGEEALLTYTLYFKDLAPKISNEENPSFKGLWAKETDSGRYIKSTPAVVRGEKLRGAVIKQFRISPLEKGTINISGYTMLCDLPVEQRKNSTDNSPDIRFRITAPELSVTARALPEPVPAGFSGAVGSFRLELLADRQTLRAGEPVILKLVITGSGSLLTLKPPTLNLPESFRQSPPETTTNLQSDGTGSAGSMTVTITAWPQSAGLFTISPLKTVVFNPVTGRFDLPGSNAIVIRVTPPLHPNEAAELKAAGSLRQQPAENTRWITGAILGLLLLIGAGVLIARKKPSNRLKSTTADSSRPPGEASGESAGTLKQLLLLELERAGINVPGRLTRKELEAALQSLNIAAEAQLECPSLLDALDRLLYTPAGKDESPAPELIARNVHHMIGVLKDVKVKR